MKYDLAEKINASVNNSTTYMTDAEQYGVPEYFEAACPGGFEDCDGYALAKRARLIEQGVPLSDLFLATCTMPDGQGHMVLAVKTDQGWFVLDNNYNWPMIPSQLPYKWGKALRSDGWVELLSFA